MKTSILCCFLFALLTVHCLPTIKQNYVPTNDLIDHREDYEDGNDTLDETTLEMYDDDNDGNNGSKVTDENSVVDGDSDGGDDGNEEDDDVLWPGGVLYYDVEDSFLDESQEMLSHVIKQFETRTCIRFVRRTNEKDWVLFSSEKNTCSSSIGRAGGKQMIHLGEGCISQGRYEHEIMHALGFIHEHSRADRDKYITIKLENVKPKYVGDFSKYSYDEYRHVDEEFDFNSVMMYRNQAFTKNGQDTIVPKEETGLRFGQRKQFSVGDVRSINKLYKCQKYLKHPNYKGLVKEHHGKVVVSD